jgi:hypothetical protein
MSTFAEIVREVLLQVEEVVFPIHDPPYMPHKIVLFTGVILNDEFAQAVKVTALINKITVICSHLYLHSIYALFNSIIPGTAGHIYAEYFY